MDVVVRLDAAADALAAVAGSAAHAAVSATQAKAVRAALEGVHLANDDAAEIAVKASGMRWFTHAHMQYALAPLEVIPTDSNGQPKRRRPNQEYATIVSYLPEGVWSALQEPSNSSQVKLDLLLQFAANAGLRLPSEPTLKLLCSAWLVASESPQELALISTAQKLAFKKHVKATFDLLRKRCPPPAEWIPVLPASPFQTQQLYAGVWSAMCADGSTPSLPPPGFRVRLQTLESTYGCRGGRKHEQQQPLSTPGQGTSNMLETLVSSVIAGQARMFELAMCGTTQSRGQMPHCMRSQTLPRALTLEMLPPSRPNVKPITSPFDSQSDPADSQSPQLALEPHRTRAIIDNAPVRAIQDQVTHAMSHAGNLAKQLPELAPHDAAVNAALVPARAFASAAVPDALDQVNQMLNMFDRRKEVKQAAKAAFLTRETAVANGGTLTQAQAKPVAIANAKQKSTGSETRVVATGVSTAATAPTAAPTAAAIRKGKGAAAKSKSKGKNAAAKTTSSTATAADDVESTGGACKSKRAAATPLAGTPKRARPMPLPAAAVKLGCSKCRFLVNGCARCRALVARARALA